MSGYDAEAAELFSAEAMVSEAAGEGRAELARLRAAAQDLLGHGWNGAAATAFAAGWHDWVHGAELVLAALDEMARALGVTGAEYEQNEIAIGADLHRVAS